MTDDQLRALTVRYRVRFDECGPTGTLRAAAYLRYAQDVAWIHSERLGYDRDWYTRRGIAWLVRGVELELLEPVRTGQELDVTTRVIGFRRIWARRQTDVRTVDSRLVAWALTDWVLTDRQGQPTRVPAEFPERFGLAAAPFSPIRVALPAQPPDALEVRFAVRYQELDPMGHANNAAYLEWIDELVRAWAGPGAPDPGALGPGAVDPGAPPDPTARFPRRYRLEYLAPVGPASALVGTAWADGDGVACRLSDEAGAECSRARLGPGSADGPPRSADRPPPTTALVTDPTP